MRFTIEAYHEINGSRADLGINGFPYSVGIVQRFSKDFEYDGMNKDQTYEELNQSGNPYISYAYNENIHMFKFQVQVTEIDFLSDLKYHSNVYLNIEGQNERYFLESKDVEFEQVDNTIYIATLMFSTEKGINILTGNEL